MRYGRLTSEDVQYKYHDETVDKCRDCDCNGDLRFGLCYACMTTVPKCDDKECPQVEFLKTAKHGAD